jgi:hypothetical protein
VKEGEDPGLVTDDGNRYTIDVVGGTAATGMIDRMTSGRGCIRD